MFIFFAVEAFILKHPQRLIWGERYFLPEWQNLFDLFNSIPLFLILLGIGYWRKSNALIVCSLSLLLHAAGDFFLHQDDGHRHFFPLLQYRFHSPVSYWDPQTSRRDCVRYRNIGHNRSVGLSLSPPTIPTHEGCISFYKPHFCPHVCRIYFLRLSDPFPYDSILHNLSCLQQSPPNLFPFCPQDDSV